MLGKKHQLFATNVYQFENPSADSDNKNWLEAILDLKKSDAGRSVSNVLGWHSSIPLLREPRLQMLAKFIDECLQEVGRQEKWIEPARFEIEGWAKREQLRRLQPGPQPRREPPERMLLHHRSS